MVRLFTGIRERAAALFFAVLCLPNASPVAAQDGGFTVRPGDSFVFKVGPVEDDQEIVAVDERSVTLKSKIFGTLVVPKSIAGAWSWTGGSFAPRYSEAIAGDVPSLFPLEVGKKVQLSGTGTTPRGSFHFAKTCTVVEKPSITVPAGTFETYRIRCDYRVLGGEPMVRTYYFAPALGYWATHQPGTGVHSLIEYKKAE